MATDWGPVLQTAIGAAAGIGGGTLGSWMQARGQRRIEQERSRERSAAEQQQRRERIAQVLADVAAFLIDLDLHRQVARPAHKTSPAQFVDTHDKLKARHQAIRGPLLTLAVSHPSPAVRRLARNLEDSLSGCLPSILYATHNPFDESTDELDARTLEAYRKCDQLFTELVDKV